MSITSIIFICTIVFRVLKYRNKGSDTMNSFDINIETLTIEQLRKYATQLNREQLFQLYYNYKKAVKDIKKELFPNIIRIPLKIEEVFKDCTKGPLFIQYCHDNGWETLHDIKHFDFHNTRIAKIGSSSMDKLHQRFNKAKDDYEACMKVASLTSLIPQCNHSMKASVLTHYGLANEIVAQYQLDNLQIADLDYLNLNGLDHYRMVKALLHMQAPFIDTFLNAWNKLTPSYQNIIWSRVQGKTLETIGNEEGKTRERVRQIIAKTAADMEKHICTLMDTFVMDVSAGISEAEISEQFTDTKLCEIFLYLLKQNKHYTYLSFAQRFIAKNQVPNRFFQDLFERVKQCIKEGINYYDLLVELDDIFEHQSFFTTSDLRSYLHACGYLLYGDFVSKNNASVALISHDAIKRHFEFDIKLDSDKNNEDMAKLRHILKNHYHLDFTSNNRALAAAITRNTSLIVLCGRGRYCPIEKVQCDSSILDALYYGIMNHKASTFYYSDLFTRYRHTLLKATNISNHHFLHGILTTFFSDSFHMSKDYFTKSGNRVDVIDHAILAMMKEKQGPISFNEMVENYPSLNRSRVAVILQRNRNMIQWSKDEYNLMENIQDQDKNFDAFLQEQFHQYNGYLSAVLLYEKMQEYDPEFLQLNQMNDERSLYYYMEYRYQHLYAFRYPHISMNKEEKKKLSTLYIASQCCNFTDFFDWKQYVEFSNTMRWKEATIYTILPILNENYRKINNKMFIRNTAFVLTDEQKAEISKEIKNKMRSNQFLSIQNIENYQLFPQLSLPWNEYLLESIVEHDLDDYTLIAPMDKDRRYVRSIIIPKQSNIQSYDELVVSIMKKENLECCSESQMKQLLKKHKLMRNTIPQDLYHSSCMWYVNEIFGIA